mmetsp:Transcript_48426/g.114343  ORF Transcript_48426/g.114343 Transcript_48426/m.114343 type:complete len:213 (-) Transcript_48426:308-946(-)
MRNHAPVLSLLARKARRSTATAKHAAVEEADSGDRGGGLCRRQHHSSGSGLGHRGRGALGCGLPHLAHIRNIGGGGVDGVGVDVHRRLHVCRGRAGAVGGRVLVFLHGVRPLALGAAGGRRRDRRREGRRPRELVCELGHGVVLRYVQAGGRRSLAAVQLLRLVKVRDLKRLEGRSSALLLLVPVAHRRRIHLQIEGGGHSIAALEALHVRV